MSLFDTLLDQCLEDRDLAATFAKVVDAMTPEQKARYEAVMAEREVADAVNN